MVKNNIFLKIYTYLFLHLILFFYSIGSVFSKLASKQEFGTFKFIMYYIIVLAILFVYAILWQQILKKLPITTVFANKAIVVVWGMIFGKLFFNENININMIIGSIVIFIGIYLVVSKSE